MDKMKGRPKGRWKRIIGAILFLLLVIATASFIWGVLNFGNISLQEIIFTLNMPLVGSSDSMILGYLWKGFVPGLLCGTALLFLWIQIRKKKIWERFRKWIPLGIIFWTGLLFFFANQAFDIIPYLQGQWQRSSFIAEHYRDPKETALNFPEKKRNLIYILMESAETGLQDQAHGGLFDVNYIPKMTQLAEENVAFSQNDALYGAAVAPASGWTIAGMVSGWAGLPLKLFEYNDMTTDNSMGRYQYFLPGATMLGDILEREGYQNVFMCGSDIRFGGRDRMLTQHGNYEILDYQKARELGRIPKDYKVWWGMEDEKVYEWAKEEILELAQGDRPFNFSMLTADTHHVDGYLSPNAPTPHDKHYANVWSFASDQVYDMVQWIQKQDFYENTTIVIAGDHCSMDPNFFSAFPYNKHSGETVRRVYNCYINSAVQIPEQREKNRSFVTQDFFPTTLASLGVRIEGERLGLGTNLFSETPTLAESLGYSELFTELNKYSKFYNQEILRKK